ncbi:MAG: UDP-N-acetylmuramoyl-L-alanine--D-glutamate ligase [Acidimicrobiia bacterium]|nr:UDP-N-acetylmuramoyl-L-alanine--D-glutamate ligase [Acidimicrobiia bacterium]MDH5519418.1 UDP-N-acetylmuramoyl-L-alanine--D-glutamate ligase [Acidimicrobiia bacterium]
MTALPIEAPLLVGFGVTGRAVARALVDRGFSPVVVDDRPNPESEVAARAMGLRLVGTPSEAQLDELVNSASALLPSPGLPDHHPAFGLARANGIPVLSEFDLARVWDDRPILAITGTNGKTTVTMMVTEILNRSGIRAEAVGNTELPLVAAIDDPSIETFVVEASSFRLAHSRRFSPRVAAWLNFAPDHLDAHHSLEAYEQAKASIWSHLTDGSVAIANADDPVVMAHAAAIDAGSTRLERFSLTERVEWSVDPPGGDFASAALHGPDGPFLTVAELKRSQPHDVANALAAAAIARSGGASLDAIAETLATFAGLPHRLEPIGTADGVTWYNDSKATVPHATVVAVAGFDSVVLIAGGKNKGLAMDSLASTVPPVRAVVATGAAAEEITAVFDSLVPVDRADSMEQAVDLARKFARPGDVVVLSPACTSFDWYANYGERGRDFTRLVHEKVLDT